MGFFTPKIEKEVYIKAKQYMDELLRGVNSMDSRALEVHLRAKLATEYDFEIAKKVASQIVYGY